MSNKSNLINKINDYNKFLSVLDKHKNNECLKKEKLSSKETTISELIKTIENNFKDQKYNTIPFNGWGTYDVIKSKLKVNDVNEYFDYYDLDANKDISKKE